MTDMDGMGKQSGKGNPSRQQHGAVETGLAPSYASCSLLGRWGCPNKQPKGEDGASTVSTARLVVIGPNTEAANYLNESF